MIGIFTGINTSKKIDIREFTINNGIPSNYKWLPVDKYYSDTLPKFKSLSSCSSRDEYNKQFSHYNTNQLTIC